MEAPRLAFGTLSDEEVLTELRKYSIGLTVEEARKIESLLGRPPTVVEAVIWGIQGSEHCSYKSSRRFLKQFPTTGRHVILGPGEDSGIVAVTDEPRGKRWGIVVSHESHNHPSQIVPFEGAATGVGGTVRDVVCMGARVIGCMDMLRLGDPAKDEQRNIAKEVIRGIAGYGNPLGIPNVGGDTVFDSSYNSNCLVNAIAIGIVREDEIIHSFVPEEAAKERYEIIIVGKPTDRSGFGGAAFASVSMEEEKKEQNTGAVQEPNPFLERHLLLSTYALFDWLVTTGNLPKVSFKDLGAGGVVCASVEQVAPRGFGAEIDLGKVHVSLPDLPPEVIGCAETQERFCWIVHPSLTEHVLRHYNQEWDLPSVAEHARASVIGHVTDDGVYTLHYRGTTVCQASATDITEGLRYERPTETPDTARHEPEITYENNTIRLSSGYSTTVADIFSAMLSHPNHASTLPLIRRYDKNVIGNTLVEAGEGDASVLQPFVDLPAYRAGGEHAGWENDVHLAKTGIVFAADGNPRYGKISAYLQGVNAVTEAVCNVVAAGAEPRALTDCLNYGNPEVPAQLGALEQGVQGIADAARGLGDGDQSVPVISGNVSLYNGTPGGGAIPPSAIVCCIGVLPDAAQAVTMQFKQPHSQLFVVGERKQECGGSAYYEVLESLASLPKDTLLGSAVPSPDFIALSKVLRLIRKAAQQKLLLSCHDISDGGLLLALFEMTTPVRKTGGVIGAEVDLEFFPKDMRTDTLLFSQTEGFVVEIDEHSLPAWKALCADGTVPVFPVGRTMPSARLRVHRDGQNILDGDLSAWHAQWLDALQSTLGL